MEALSVLPFYEYYLKQGVMDQEGGGQCVLVSMSQGFDSGIDKQHDSSSDGSEMEPRIPSPPPPPPLPSYIEEFQSIIPTPPPPPPIASCCRITTPPPLPGSAIDTHTPILQPPPPIEQNQDQDLSIDQHRSVSDRPEIVILSAKPMPFQSVETVQCAICYQTIHSTHNLKCCSRKVCRECMDQMIKTNIDKGIIKISCPFPDCEKYIASDDVKHLLQPYPKYLEKYSKFREARSESATEKVCPRCALLTHHQVPKRLFGPKESDIKLTCERCSLEWCFKCHAPWHTHQSCREFKSGNKEFRHWMKGRNNKGSANAHKCPSCNIPIQRSSGCTHMTCSKCNTHFCYVCGHKYTYFPGLGDHYSGLSVFGCPRQYRGSEKTREAVRYGYLVSKLSAGLAYPALCIAGIGIVAVGATVVLPVYGGVKLYKQVKKNKRERRRREAAAQRPRLVDEFDDIPPEFRGLVLGDVDPPGVDLNALLREVQDMLHREDVEA